MPFCFPIIILLIYETFRDLFDKIRQKNGSVNNVNNGSVNYDIIMSKKTWRGIIILCTGHLYSLRHQQSMIIHLISISNIYYKFQTQNKV